MNKLAVLATTFIAISSAHAIGDTYIRSGNIYTQENTWVTGVGVLGATDLYKGQKKNLKPTLSFGYHGEDFNADNQGINYRFWGENEDLINMSGYLTTSGIAFDQDTSDYLKGMKKRKLSFDAGLNADFHLAYGTLSTYAQHDVSGVHNGYSAGAKYFYPTKLGQVDFVPFAGLAYMDKDFVNYYFGVTEKEAKANRKAYSGSGAFAYNLGYKLVMPLNDNWEISQTSTYTRLSGDVADSPIVKSANHWVASAEITYKW